MPTTVTAARTPPESGFSGEALRRHARAAALPLLGLLALTALVGLIGVSIGPAFIDIGSVMRVLGVHLLGLDASSVSRTTDTIVWITRVPRVVMGLGTGAVLAMSGAALQALVRNPLADPYVLGINAGASTGAAFAIIVFAGTGGGVWLLSGSAFVGAAVATVLVIGIVGTTSAGGPLRLVLAGMAVGYALSAVTNFLIFASDSPEASRSVMFWMLGSLAAIHPPTALLGLATAVALGLFLTASGSWLDALAAGDEVALGVGVKPGRARIILMLVVSMAVGVVVAGAGSIGFVGLVVPHLARAVVGARHRLLIPASALLGACFLVVADVGARMLFVPQEMPIGVVTGLVGAPFLLALLRRQRQGIPLSSRPRIPFRKGQT
ncbi:MAG: FecCD family ABC transporter permease [Propioniciclava sp.]